MPAKTKKISKTKKVKKTNKNVPKTTLTKSKQIKKVKAAKAVKKEKKAVNATQKGGNPLKQKPRYFKVILDGENAESAHGRFSGTKPKQAANKALTSIIKTEGKKGNQIEGKLKFSIMECTRGSKHKRYYYEGERKKLENPMKVIIGPKKDLPKDILDKLESMSDDELAKHGLKRIKYGYENKVMKDKSAHEVQ